MKKFLTNERNSILFFAAVLLIAAVFITAVSDIGCDKTAEDRAQLEKAVANAAVACYAVEGAYPPSVEYLTEYYGVQISTSSVFSSSVLLLLLLFYNHRFSSHWNPSFSNFA